MTSTRRRDSSNISGIECFFVGSGDSKSSDLAGEMTISIPQVYPLVATAEKARMMETVSESEASGYGTGDVDPRLEQERTLAAPRRRYGLPAQVLFFTMNVVYGRDLRLPTFRVLEVVARMPYQAWESVAYVAETHTHESPEFARRIHDRVEEARHQQDNELWHLLILEEMLHRQGHRSRPIRDRLFPQILAFVYYQISWLLYVVKPTWSYRLNADFEDHAEHSYMEFVQAHPELEAERWDSAFDVDYGRHDTVADLFRQIALDERDHKESSEAHMEHARFAAPDQLRARHRGS